MRRVPFADVLGQEPAVRTLERALAAGKVHHAYRFEGPAGVGKELLAFALAQTLVCERGGAAACGQCSACRRAVSLSGEEPRVPLHPDVVLLGRGLYRSVLGSGASEATGISVEQVRRIVLARVGFPPHEGRALVFIVRDADEITVQAANALLKTLEEPHARTHFILLTSRPSRLLDTIRSRSLPVRFAPLSDR
ncbi:MAG TPA: DNA polymerase III subunit delta', partial [Polyangiaceae bacterium]|nr:DNA polymerase III subunit delta' [Polyangiaceae bacterium]